MNLLETLGNIFGGLTFTWANALMLVIGGALIYLAVAKEYEPVLLLPIGFGCVLANLGMSAYAEESFMRVI
ncbi:MAG: sodium ion-translocating decarboxylase subunit beta, partial [Chloroflexota bacterium]